jgi:hypothetical protein
MSKKTKQALALAFGVVLAGIAQAQTLMPAIERIVADPHSRLLTISGVHFTRPVSLNVNGEAEELTLISVNGRELRAILPSHVRDGTYLLRLMHGAERPRLIEAPFTIGPVGPVLDEKH